MGDLGSTSTFYAARPTVLLDGRENPGLTNGLLSLLVEETTAGLFRCEVVFGNWGTGNGEVDYLYFDRRVFDFGKPLAIQVGEGDTAARIFDGRVTGLEAHYPKTSPPELVVLAEDRLQDLRMTRRTRSFEQVSDGDMMRQVAAQHSLRAMVDVTGPTYNIVAQVNQSDLAFLRERARAIDAELWVEGDTLRAVARASRTTGRLTLTYGQGLKEFSALADLARQRTSLVVSGWDVRGKTGIEYEAAEAAIRGELNGDQSGGSLLRRAFGQRTERIVHHVPLSAEEARALAEAHYRSLARQFVTGQGVAEGDGRIRVGARVELKGLGKLFDGQYYVPEARHLFDGQNGYRTQFMVERPGVK